MLRVDSVTLFSLPLPGAVSAGRSGRPRPMWCLCSRRRAALRTSHAANSPWAPMPRSPPAPVINAEIYSYSRSRGLFAGVALDGTVIAFDRHANDAFYHSDEVTTTEITGGKVTTHSETASR